MSRPGQYFNFNVSNPTRADDAITATLAAGILQTIKSIVSSTSGMLVLTDNTSWILNGGSAGSAITPAAIVANAQSYNGANDIRPIVANYDVLYVQEKGSSVRDLAFNIYFNVFTGSDISIISSHLFFGHQVIDWAWAEEPFRIVWAIRDDGLLLSLTFMKEQEFIAWARHVTAGTFTAVATVTETPGSEIVDATYFVASRGVSSAASVVTQDVSAIWSGDFAFDPRQQQMVVAGGFLYFSSGFSICRIATSFSPATLQHFNYTTLVFDNAGDGNVIDGLRFDGTNVVAVTASGTSGGVTKWTMLTFQPSNFTLGASTGVDGANTLNGSISPFGYMALHSGFWYGTQGEPPTGPPTNTRVQRINASTQAITTIDLSTLVSNVNGDCLVDVTGNRVFFCAPSSGKLVQVDIANFDLAHSSIAYDLTTLANWSSGVSPSPTNKLMHAWIDDADTYIYILYKTTTNGVNCARIRLSDLSLQGNLDLTTAYPNFATAVDRPIDGWTWANGQTFIFSSSVRGPFDNGTTRVLKIDATFTTISVDVLSDIDPALTARYASWTSDGTSFYSQPVNVDLSANTFLLKYTPCTATTATYIERLADRFINNSLLNAWTVDSGVSYSGPPATTFSGGEHLAGQTVTGLADGVIIPSFTMPLNGIFTLGVAASNVVVGIPFTCQLQTLALDVGDPSIQGKVKKIPFVDIRVTETLGLSIGQDFDHLVPMKDLIVNNVSSTLTGQEVQVVNGLVTGDARTFLGPTYTVPGQYCIEQPKPYPSQILGVFPAVVQGDER